MRKNLFSSLSKYHSLTKQPIQTFSTAAKQPNYLIGGLIAGFRSVSWPTKCSDQAPLNNLKLN